MRPQQPYFLLKSSFVQKHREVLQVVYQVGDFLSIIFDALRSIIDYVQNNELFSFMHWVEVFVPFV